MDNFDVKILCDYTSEDGMRKASIATCGMVCSKQIDIVIDGDVIRAVHYSGGCNGNLKGIGSLVAGMKIRDVIGRLEGIDCGGRGTSCPDQLARALKQLLQNSGN